MPGEYVVVSVYGRTHRGRVRDENQDRLLVLDLAKDEDRAGGVPHEGPVGAELDEDRVGGDPDAEGVVGPLAFPLGARGAALLVADGMGGPAGGARASGLAITEVREALLDPVESRDGAGTDADFVRRLAGSLLSANATIRAEASEGGPHAGMGTTATLAGLFGGCVFVAQVGDSRAYLHRCGRLGRLTRDQSLAQEMIDSGVLTEADARSVPNNMILQALGTATTIRPAVTHHDLARGDTLILCSDGLSQVVDDDELEVAASDAADCRTLCERLVSLANERGGPDNITVLVVRIGGAGLPEPTEGVSVELRNWEAP